jgi:hypothetical protein
MGLRETLQAEAEARAAHLATVFAPSRCIACGSTKAADLSSTDFKWRKQVGRSQHHHERVTHTSTHMLCPPCLTELRRRRRRFWPLRYAGGIALAAALCAVIATPILLACMRLAPDERSQMIATGAAGLLLLPAAGMTLRAARRFSVPACLFDMTGNGWECIGVTNQAT